MVDVVVGWGIAYKLEEVVADMVEFEAVADVVVDSAWVFAGVVAVAEDDEVAPAASVDALAPTAANAIRMQRARRTRLIRQAPGQ